MAEDLVSEIFLKALEHFPDYDERISSSAWVMTIAKNHLANYWRDTDESEDNDEGGKDNFWLAATQLSQLKEADISYLYDLLAHLNQEEAAIVTFHYLFGYSYAEIAEMRGSTIGAVKVAAHRGIKKLRALS